MITAQCKRRDGHMPLREHKDKNEASEVSVPLAGCAEQSCQGHSGDLSFFLISGKSASFASPGWCSSREAKQAAWRQLDLPSTRAHDLDENINIKRCQVGCWLLVWTFD